MLLLKEYRLNELILSQFYQTGLLIDKDYVILIVLRNKFDVDNFAFCHCLIFIY